MSRWGCWHAALADAGTDDVVPSRASRAAQRLEAPQGEVWIDEQNLHAYLTPRIGRSNRNARFDIIREATAPVQPDPYLVNSTPRFDVAAAPPA